MNSLEVPIVTPANMPHLGKIKAVLYMSEVVLSLLILCTVVPVIATEIRFYEGSQAAPNWMLVVTLMTWWIPVVLFYFPWAYDRHNTFRRFGKFFLKPRTNLIFSIFGTFLWGSAAIAMTVHANNPTHCTLDSDLVDDPDDGAGYASAWPVQCSCAKAATAFGWLNCFCWLATLVCSIIVSWNEKQLARQTSQQPEHGKLEISSADPYLQHTPAVIPPSTTTPPFYQPPATDPYIMPMSAATSSLPPHAHTPYNSDPSYHNYQ